MHLHAPLLPSKKSPHSQCRRARHPAINIRAVRQSQIRRHRSSPCATVQSLFSPVRCSFLNQSISACYSLPCLPNKTSVDPLPSLPPPCAHLASFTVSHLPPL